MDKQIGIVYVAVSGRKGAPYCMTCAEEMEEYEELPIGSVSDTYIGTEPHMASDGEFECVRCDDEIQASEEPAVARARAVRLVEGLEELGLNYGDEEARELELGRLAGLSVGAFAAHHAACVRLVRVMALVR